jgi:hypothetical protein
MKGSNEKLPVCCGRRKRLVAREAWVANFSLFPGVPQGREELSRKYTGTLVIFESSPTSMKEFRETRLQ